MKTGKNFLLLISLALSALLLTACGGSSSSSSSTPAATPQAYPSNLSAIAGDVQVNLSWTAVIGASTYTVYYATTDLTASTNATALQSVAGISSMTVSAISADITGLSNGTAYYFKVTALTATGESQPSDQATATPFVPAPTNLVATAGENQVSLSWTGIAGDTTYTVYYATIATLTASTSLDSVTGISSMTVSTTSTDITGLAGGTTYYFSVTALKAGVHSLPSNVATATPVPAAPTGLVATAGFQQATLSWNAVTSASYKVYYGKESFANLDTISNYNTVNGTMVAVASTAVSHTIKGLDNDTLYYFVVTAVIADAESAASTEATATPSITNLGSISTATRAANISSADQVDWYQFTASTSANYVALAVGNSTTAIGFYSTEPDFNSCAATTDNGTEAKNTYATQDTTANETYYLCVTATDNATGTYNLNVVSVNSTVSTNNASFIYFANDVVLEKDTSLFWQRTNVEKNWTNAGSHCDGLTLAGYDNWSLPTKDELIMIGERDETIKSSFTRSSSDYWSSTEDAGSLSNARVVNFSSGYEYSISKSVQYYVRCVIR